MMRRTLKGLPLLASLVPVALLVAGPGAAPPAAVTIDTPMPAPAWAKLERRLLAENVPACREFTKNTTTPAATCSAFCAGARTTGPTMRSRTSIGWPELHALGATTRSSGCYLEG